MGRAKKSDNDDKFLRTSTLVTVLSDDDAIRILGESQGATYNNMKHELYLIRRKIKDLTVVAEARNASIDKLAPDEFVAMKIANNRTKSIMNKYEDLSIRQIESELTNLLGAEAERDAILTEITIKSRSCQHACHSDKDPHLDLIHGICVVCRNVEAIRRRRKVNNVYYISWEDAHEIYVRGENRRKAVKMLADTDIDKLRASGLRLCTSNIHVGERQVPDTEITSQYGNTCKICYRMYAKNKRLIAHGVRVDKEVLHFITINKLSITSALIDNINYIIEESQRKDPSSPVEIKERLKEKLYYNRNHTFGKQRGVIASRPKNLDFNRFHINFDGMNDWGDLDMESDDSVGGDNEFFIIKAKEPLD